MIRQWFKLAIFCREQLLIDAFIGWAKPSGDGFCSKIYIYMLSGDWFCYPCSDSCHKIK